MPFVVVSIGGEEVSRHPVTGPSVIGRSTDSDISVRDASMSRWHCRIEPNPEKAGAFIITDLGSRNGTTVNGRRVSKQPLHHGDLLRIGRVNVHFSTGDFVPGPAAPQVARSSKREVHPVLAGVGGEFARPLLTIDCRLPRPDPAKPGVRKVTPHELEIMSSPGWSAKLRPDSRIPTPSVDMSPGELAEREQKETVDITHLSPTDRPARQERQGWFGRMWSWFIGR